MRGDQSPIGSRAMAMGLARGRDNVVLVEGQGIGHMAPLTSPSVILTEISRHLERVG